jgi:RNA recognition motif-containing protein
MRGDTMNIYVGNLSYTVTEEDLQNAFQAFGNVASTSIIRDKFSNQSKGFGFVEMVVKEEAQAAISAMNGKELKGRTLNVNEARPRSDDRRGGGGGRRLGGRPRY